MRESYSSGAAGRCVGSAAATVLARFRPMTESATLLACRNIPGRDEAGESSGTVSCPALAASCGPVDFLRSSNTAHLSRLFRSVEGLKTEPVSSFTGDMGCWRETGIPEVTIMGGAECRPGRGSELLRRLFASHDSSPRLCSVRGIPVSPVACGVT